MIYFNWLFALILSGVALFMILGLLSRRGKARGLTPEGRLAPLPRSPNCVSSEKGTAEAKAVAALPTTNLDAVAAAIDKTGGTVKAQTQSYLHAEYKSDVFGFIDDVECRMDDGVTHIRSASRAGYSDRGVNRKRVEAIRLAL